MELVEIIIYVLKLFSLSSFILLSLSYFFFKMKDRTRIKPYMLINTDPTAYEAPKEKETEAIIPGTLPDTLPDIIIDSSKYKKFTKRFKVVNEIQRKKAEKARIFEPVWPQTYQPQIQIVAQKIQPANIYNFYSSDNEPMHKLKLSVVSK